MFDPRSLSPGDVVRLEGPPPCPGVSRYEVVGDPFRDDENTVVPVRLIVPTDRPAPRGGWETSPFALTFEDGGAVNSWFSREEQGCTG